MTLKDIKKELNNAINKYGEDTEVEFLDSDFNEYNFSLDGELTENDEDKENFTQVLRCYID